MLATSGGQWATKLGLCSELRNSSLGGARKSLRLGDRVPGCTGTGCVTLDESLQLSGSASFHSENKNAWEAAPLFSKYASFCRLLIVLWPYIVNEVMHAE